MMVTLFSILLVVFLISGIMGILVGLYMEHFEVKGSYRKFDILFDVLASITVLSSISMFVIMFLY